MPPRDEESRFEQVLARHLRRRGTDAGCPDAETLAAYHERALTPEEMNAFKGHIAACGRCQEVLAGLEASEGVTARERDALHVAEFDFAAAAMPAAREPGVSPAPAMAGRPKRVWKWMAPAAAVAAGLLVWVSVQQIRHAPPETTTVAVNTPSEERDGDRPSPEPGAQVPAKSSDQRASLAEKQARSVAPDRRGGLAAPRPPDRSGTRMETDSLTAQLSGGREQKLDQTAPRQDENARTNADNYSAQAEGQVSALTKQRAVGGEQAASGKQKTPPSRAEQFSTEAGKKEAERQFAAEDAPTKPLEYRAGQATAMEKTNRTIQEEHKKEAQADKDVGGVAVDAAETSAPGLANERKKRAAPGFAKPAAAPPAPLALRDHGALFAKSAAGLVLTPEKDVMWRVGAAGMILKTVDGGSSWTQQASGVNVELLAGSAPSETICWLVGRGGTILRTTDGEHWQRIASPAKSDLIGIDARNAQTAVVWTPEKLPEYVTRDGGKTWQRAGAGEQP